MGIFISWVARHGRSASLAAAVNFEEVNVTHHWPTPFKYVPMAIRTWRIIRAEKPDCIIVMQPPLPALIVARLAAPRETRVIADLHTGALLDPRWRPFRRLTLRLCQASGAIVTNDELKKICTAAGVEAFTLDDPLVIAENVNRVPERKSATILVPFAYANDEPVDELLLAASKRPTVRFLLTGRAPSTVTAAAPANVQFTGFVPDEEYRALMGEVTAAAALTTRPHTMQRVGYEAIETATPLITSQQEVLAAYFGSAAEYCDNTAEEICRAIDRICADPPAAQARMQALAETKVREQEQRLYEFAGWISRG